MTWVALCLTAETAVFVLAGIAWFLSRGYTFAEAGAGAVAMVFMALSLIHQISFVIGSPLPGFILEPAILACLFIFWGRRVPSLFRKLASATRLVRQEMFSGWTIATAWMVMAGLVVHGWLSTAYLPSDHPWNGLMTGSAFGGLGQMALIDAISPLNATALFYHTARFGLGPNACGFGVLAHLAVGFSTYALARRYAWPPMALTVTLMVLSMPRLVYLGLWPSAELISTSAIAFSMVLIYRLLEQHQSGDLRFFLLCILFSIYANPMSLALVPVMGLLLVVIMIRRHGWLLCREMLADQPLLTALTLLPAMGFAQLPVFAWNMIHDQPLVGTAIAFDNGGIIGAAVNLVRYLLISFDPTEPVQRMLVWLVGLDLRILATGVYSRLMMPVFGHVGGEGALTFIFSGGSGMGFGPFALLLVVPSMIYALVRGPRRLKAVSVAWAGYLYLAALVVAWHPGSLAVLSPVYVANGFVVAFALPPWRLRRRGMRLLQTAFALLLAWSIVSAGSTPV
ncbi:hypothetical protein [Desulfosarcina sp.]|uniref:hypothetical protein n=1 Tax=Desulfosarcina sp. TaxID=2027861 RepID=UPI0035634362